jgi:hypothetical protein
MSVIIFDNLLNGYFHIRTKPVLNDCCYIFFEFLICHKNPPNGRCTGKTITFRISRMIKRYADNRLEIQTSVIKKSTHRELRGFTLS